MFFLPEPLKSFINKNISTVHELRIRRNRPVYVNFLGKFKKLIINGCPVVLTEEQLNEVVNRACEYSFYKHNETIKSGYLTAGGGVRIGLAGECVYENGNIKTIKNFTSISIN
jgi:stage III sporulation protein AA